MSNKWKVLAGVLVVLLLSGCADSVSFEQAAEMLSLIHI